MKLRTSQIALAALALGTATAAEHDEAWINKRIEEIKNYAVANEKVVVFDNHHIKKIPLADIDLAATMKLNDERGVDFQIPNSAGTE